MEILSLINFIEKLSTLVERLTNAKDDRERKFFLQRALYLYIRLGDLYSSGNYLNQALYKYLFQQSDQGQMSQLSGYSLASAINGHQHHAKLVGEEITEIFLSIIAFFDDNNESDKFWMELKSAGYIQDTLCEILADADVMAGHHEKIKIEENRRKRNVLKKEKSVQRASISIPVFGNHPYSMEVIKINLNDPSASDEANQAFQKFANRRSLHHIKEGRQRLKEIINTHWDTDDILDALDTDKLKISDFGN